MIIRLLLAGLMGGIIGLERESHGRPAGLRTHIIVSLGSCLIMLVSIYGFEDAGNRDPARLAAQVISGIGFLGAGTILREGATIIGLTTAASLWVVAGIGLAMGGGFYLGGVATTILAVCTLAFLDKIENKWPSTEGIIVEGIVEDKPGQLVSFCKVFSDHAFNIKNISVEINEEKSQALIILHLKGRPQLKEKILEELSALPGVIKVNWR
ncbi:MAG: MgtC/SapB family protein [Firmicutes bacterium]|mgnify:CR=1 FL=1|jgi:putative Mg2+ transporter-C (MgtC) family protein|nr:MgtC/SapB family protein [Bacillota bacterium]